MVFSFCSRLLEEIILNFNKHKCLPEGLDLRQNLPWYKPFNRNHDDIFNDYFKKLNNDIKYNKDIIFSNDDRYLDFKTLKYDELLPFLHKYFTPTEEIMGYVNEIETTYNIQDYKNICCLFYRGNDKVTETKLAPYDDFVKYGKEQLEKMQTPFFNLI